LLLCRPPPRVDLSHLYNGSCLLPNGEIPKLNRYFTQQQKFNTAEGQQHAHNILGPHDKVCRRRLTPNAPPRSVIPAGDGRTGFVLYEGKARALGTGHFGKTKLAQRVDLLSGKPLGWVAVKIQKITWDKGYQHNRNKVFHERRMLQAAGQLQWSVERQGLVDSQGQRCDKIYFFQEIAPGENQQTYLEKKFTALAKATTPQQKQAIMQELLMVFKATMTAVAEFHAKGLIHFDLKMDNTTYEETTGIATLLDLGGADFAPSDKNSTVYSNGSFASMYAAPELLHPLKEGPKGNQASDIYAMATSYLWYSIMPALTQAGCLNGELKREIEALQNWMLAAKPQHRPTAAQVVQMLEMILTRFFSPSTQPRSPVSSQPLLQATRTHQASIPEAPIPNCAPADIAKELARLQKELRTTYEKKGLQWLKEQSKKNGASPPITFEQWQDLFARNSDAAKELAIVLGKEAFGKPLSPKETKFKNDYIAEAQRVETKPAEPEHYIQQSEKSEPAFAKNATKIQQLKSAIRTTNPNINWELYPFLNLKITAIDFPKEGDLDCPNTREEVTTDNAVICSDDHIYSREGIEPMLEARDYTSPMTRALWVPLPGGEYSKSVIECQTDIIKALEWIQHQVQEAPPSNNQSLDPTAAPADIRRLLSWQPTVSPDATLRNNARRIAQCKNDIRRIAPHYNFSENQLYKFAVASYDFNDETLHAGFTDNDTVVTADGVPRLLNSPETLTQRTMKGTEAQEKIIAQLIDDRQKIETSIEQQQQPPSDNTSTHRTTANIDIPPTNSLRSSQPNSRETPLQQNNIEPVLLQEASGFYTLYGLGKEEGKTVLYNPKIPCLATSIQHFDIAELDNQQDYEKADLDTQTWFQTGTHQLYMRDNSSDTSLTQYTITDGTLSDKIPAAQQRTKSSNSFQPFVRAWREDQGYLLFSTLKGNLPSPSLQTSLSTQQQPSRTVDAALVADINKQTTNTLLNVHNKKVHVQEQKATALDIQYKDSTINILKTRQTANEPPKTECYKSIAISNDVTNTTLSCENPDDTCYTVMACATKEMGETEVVIAVDNCDDPEKMRQQIATCTEALILYGVLPTLDDATQTSVNSSIEEILTEYSSKEALQTFTTLRDKLLAEEERTSCIRKAP